jgi:DNA repair exonuclease SbcCD ATPase subunit
MNNLSSLKCKLISLQSDLNMRVTKLTELQSDLSDIEVNPDQYTDLDSLYDAELDEIYFDACEALPINISGSQLLREFDPIMYRCGFSDFCSNYDYKSLDIYTDKESEIEDLESEISDLESEIEDLENEIDELLAD